MYARPSNKAAHDALWGLIRDNLRDYGVIAPDALDHETDHMAGWARPDLVLGQICNLPYRAKFLERVTAIGAADYGLDDCAPGYYRSVFITHFEQTSEDPSEMPDTRFAYNDELSQSGYGAPQLWAADRNFQFNAFLKTGSHKASIAAVAAREADITAIDAQTWRIECAENPHTKELRIIGYTDPSPGMTFITRQGEDPNVYFEAIQKAISDLSAADAKVLGLKGIVALPKTAYDLPFPPKRQSIQA